MQAGITADQRAPNVVPALIADLGDEAAWRYVEFFAANIRQPQHPPRLRIPPASAPVRVGAGATNAA